MSVGIYLIKNWINGKKYYGQSTNVEDRLLQHEVSLKGNYHDNDHLQKSFNKYGRYNFTFEKIGDVEEENLNYVERWLIQSENTNNPKYGYNKNDGGSLNFRQTLETREKISEKKKEYYRNNPEAIEQRREFMKGDKNPSKRPDVAKKISESLSGENHIYFGKKRPGHSKKMEGKGNSNYRNDLDDQEILKLAKEQYTTTEIACILNTNSTTIGERLKLVMDEKEYENFIHINRSKGHTGENNVNFIDLDEEKILKLANEGKNLSEIARLTNVHYTTIGERLKKYMDEDEYKKYTEKNSKKYTVFWNPSYCRYNKHKMTRNGREPNPVKCFAVNYNGRRLNIGLFHDFVSVNIIHKLINEFLK